MSSCGSVLTCTGCAGPLELEDCCGCCAGSCLTSGGGGAGTAFVVVPWYTPLPADVTSLAFSAPVAWDPPLGIGGVDGRDRTSSGGSRSGFGGGGGCVERRLSRLSSFGSSGGAAFGTSFGHFGSSGGAAFGTSFGIFLASGSFRSSIMFAANLSLLSC